MDELTTCGPVFTPGHDGYDTERIGYQRLTAHRPALIVGAVDAGDVQAVIRHAAARGTSVAVQATGHGLGDPMERGILISTRRMTAVGVDPAARTAWVEAGATWRHVIEAAAPYGLAPPSGSFPGVGAISYTLGGGVGLLARRHGFAADHVRRVDLVGADGALRRVTADTDPDLFWALRGAGHGFGVVTGMEIDLMPVARLFGGGLYFDAEQVPDALEGWREWTSTVPEEMTSAVAMLPFPDLPAVPEPLRGRHVIQLQLAYAGPADRAERLVKPLRDIGPRLLDTLRDLPYAESGAVFDEPDRPHAYLSDNLLVNDLSPAALTALVRDAGPTAPLMCVVGLRHLGGALSRPPRVPNAVAHRDAAYSLTVLSPAESGDPRRIRAFHRALLAPFTANAVGSMENFLYGPGHDDPSPAEHRERLTGLKARHDPAGLFHDRRRR